MKFRRTSLPARRPIEYILICVVLLLLVFAAWANWRIKQDNESESSETVSQSESFSGTAEEVGTLTEQESHDEERLDDTFDQEELKQIDMTGGAADGVGVSYDETLY